MKKISRKKAAASLRPRYPVTFARAFCLLFVSMLVSWLPGTAMAQDTSPPDLVNFQILPPTVPEGGQATLWITTTDDLSGLYYAEVSCFSPSFNWVAADTLSSGLTPPAGQLNTTIPLPLMIPMGSETGVWTCHWLYMYDYEGFTRWVYLPDFLGVEPTFTVVASGGGDIIPPNLTRFDFYPKSVNVATQDATVTVDLNVTDDSSGFDSATVTFTSPSSASTLSVTANLTMGTALDGEAIADLTVPMGSEAGDWTISSISLIDLVGNPITLDTAALAAMGYPTTLAVSTTPQFSDTTPPSLIKFDFNPKSVDVTGSDAVIDITGHITDDLSGFSYGSLYAYSPSYGQSAYGYFYVSSGSALNGDIQGQLTIPRNGEAGDWTISGLTLCDYTNNCQWLDTPTLASLNMPTIVSVTSSNADTTPPQLTSFALSPAAVNVSSSSQAITFTLGISDDNSGVDLPCTRCYYTVTLASPSGKQTQMLVDWNLSLLSGNQQAGVWQGALTLPRYAEAGNWKVRWVTLHDVTGNVVSLDTAALSAKGFPTTIAVTSSPADTQPPQLTSLSFSPNFADTSASGKTITVTASLTDNLSGVNFTSSMASFHYSYLMFQSPSGNQYLYVSLREPRLAGTSTNGTWQGTGYLPQYSEAGTWNITGMGLYDVAGNNVYYNNAQLAALGVPTTIQVILPSLVSDGAVADPSVGGAVEDDVFGERASITIPAGLLSQPTTVSIDVLSSDLHLPTPSGFSTNGTNFVNIKLDPEPAMPLPAPGLTITLPLLNQMLPGTVLTLYKIDPVSGNLVPEPSVGGGPATGTVNEDGLSATFTGVASLSTLVGLIPSGGVLGDLNGDDAVNCADIAIVRLASGKRLGQEGYDSRADTNRDNVVNVRDLAFVSRNLPAGVVCRITTTGAVPR